MYRADIFVPGYTYLFFGFQCSAYFCMTGTVANPDQIDSLFQNTGTGNFIITYQLRKRESERQLFLLAWIQQLCFGKCHKTLVFFGKLSLRAAGIQLDNFFSRIDAA